MSKISARPSDFFPASTTATARSAAAARAPVFLEAGEVEVEQPPRLPRGMRRRAEAATKTLLKEAKREEQQIAGVMEARASTGVRLVEGPVRRR